MNDDFLFADDDDENEQEDLGSWKVLIVDDEPEVHAVTKLALNDFSLNGKTLEFVSAYSGEEAKAIFKAHNDIAVVLLDVVMEADDAGLQVADYIRNELDNHFTRIILRTGQPGQAPEKTSSSTTILTTINLRQNSLHKSFLPLLSRPFVRIETLLLSKKTGGD